MSLVFIRCQPLSFAVTSCHSHSLYHSLLFVVTCCHSFSLVVPLVVTRYILVCLFINDVITILVFSRFLDIRGNIKEKLSRKTYFSHEMKHLPLHIYLAKFCQTSFLWCQRSLYCNFMRKRCWNGGEYVKSFENEILSVK